MQMLYGQKICLPKKGKVYAGKVMLLGALEVRFPAL
jgi:hypothetical protein